MILTRVFVLGLSMPIEYYEFKKFGGELEPFGWNLVVLWLVLGSIMFWSIYALKERPWIWVIIITTFGFIFEYFINPHQEAKLLAVLVAWFFLFGVIPAAAIWLATHHKKPYVRTKTR